ncbi:hypothetical protein GTQ48_08025 [Alteromonas genovensis]|uniref:Uncharacterized protein n=1 Tax=Alteromonas genovensis TaxID=471225 RepID=A0A6N9THA5_9ALTE|nr:hypothetical protein [Alteromonas genovensis]NDW15465.1 hypothetical protein [Alteromonas genovensis]
MGPGTQVKNIVGEFHFKRITNPAFIGIFDCQRNNFPPRLNASRKKVEIRRSILTTSFLGDCTGYPKNGIAEAIIGEQHLEFLESYVKSIPQDVLWFAADCGLYSHITLKFLAMLAKQSGKSVNSIAIPPLKLYGPRVSSNFEASWGEITEYCDSSVLIEASLDKETASMAKQEGFNNLLEQVKFVEQKAFNSLLEKVEFLEQLASNFVHYPT